ncbi:hypothetical protein VA603_06235 [Stenotrophomonas sp. MH1]|uniref:Lipoprotein n=1 Tax=Stenotrophomonas capsici TaxID=3110230 RepID=A0ABU5V2U1_9GAMM|nr:hypothetical protein [Stenotrophomonas sp. MH1]MEA5667133.1 hypothetical protein [Stenotrophomonas sp. MH1]
MKRIEVVTLAACALLAVAGCKKEEALTQKGDINLAGCEVPAGLTPAEAEALGCPSEEAGPVLASGPVALASDETVINEALTRVAFTFDQSEEDVEARRFAEGDLNGDGVSDKVVLFVLQATNGGNAYATHVAGFVSEGGVLRYTDAIPVAGYGEGVQEFSVQDGTLTMRILTQGPDDPTCCPSVEKRVSYLLHHGKFIEANPVRN